MPDVHSQTTVCNRAMMNLRRERTMQDVALEAATNVSDEAIVCNMVYAAMRDEVLENHDWTVARAAWTLSAHANSPPNEWSFRYQMPTSDVIAPRYITQPTQSRLDTPIPFQFLLSDDKSENTMVTDTDVSGLQLIYTYRLEDLNRWWEVMVTALVWRITLEAALGLGRDEDTARKADENWRRLLSVARTHDMNIGHKGMDQRKARSITARA